MKILYRAQNEKYLENHHGPGELSYHPGPNTIIGYFISKRL